MFDHLWHQRWYSQLVGLENCWINCFVQLSKGGRNLLKRATINAVFPLVLFMPNAISLSLYILQKANFLGAQGQPNFTPLIADGVAGAVIGLSFTCVLGTLPPYIAYASGKAGVRVIYHHFVCFIDHFLPYCKWSYTWLACCVTLQKLSWDPISPWSHICIAYW